MAGVTTRAPIVYDEYFSDITEKLYPFRWMAVLLCLSNQVVENRSSSVMHQSTVADETTSRLRSSKRSWLQLRRKDVAHRRTADWICAWSTPVVWSYGSVVCCH